MTVIPNFRADIDQAAAPVLSDPFLFFGSTAVCEETDFIGYSSIAYRA